MMGLLVSRQKVRPSEALLEEEQEEERSAQNAERKREHRREDGNDREDRGIVTLHHFLHIHRNEYDGESKIYCGFESPLIAIDEVKK